MTAGGRLVEHLALVKLLIVLSDSVGVDGADVTAGAADVGGVVDELARVIVILRWSVTTVLV